MLRHSFATLEEEQEFVVFYRALFPLGKVPSLFLQFVLFLCNDVELSLFQATVRSVGKIITP